MHHPYTEALLASVPKLEARTKVELRHIPGCRRTSRRTSSRCRFAAALRVRDRAVPGDGSGLDRRRHGHLFACFHPVDGPRPTCPVAEEAEARRERRAGPELLGDRRPREGVPDPPGPPPAADRRHPGGRPACRSRSARARRSGSSASRGAGRPPSAGCWSAIEPPTAGSVDVPRPARSAGSRASSARSPRRDRQMMFQDPYASLNPRMRVRDDHPRAARGPEARDRGRAERTGATSCMREVGLDPQRRGALPARVLRRAAPADRPRSGARARTRSSSWPTSPSPRSTSRSRPRSST